jgi:hypothetical protein
MLRPYNPSISPYSDVGWVKRSGTQRFRIVAPLQIRQEFGSFLDPKDQKQHGLPEALLHHRFQRQRS